MESRTKFVNAMDMAMRNTAIQELENAVDYYLKVNLIKNYF
jgi:hypothetical protein